MVRTRDMPIGVFDSGVGGLTVMRAIVERLPDEDITYLGDTARVPYGNRAAETVRRYALNATRLLADRGIKALVVACNTATASALGTLVDHFDVPVVGVVDPVARAAADTSHSSAIGVLGTRGTVRSGCYPEALARFAPGCSVHQVPAPLLVPLAEEGWLRGDVVEEIARHYLRELSGTRIDTIILGCTHYPILQPVLQTTAEDVLETDVTLLDSASATADALAERLEEHDLRANDLRANDLRANDLRAKDLPEKTAGTPSLDFLFTDVSPSFVEATERFFGDRPESLRHVDITP